MKANTARVPLHAARKELLIRMEVDIRSKFGQDL
jgi:hypothetical protein